MQQDCYLKFENITKRFPGVVAVDNVSIEIAKGSCHSLVGENGAGKSTLGKILAGIHQPDSGKIFIAGVEKRFRHAGEAFKAGIGMVHQELEFCENLSVAENLCLSDLPAGAGIVNKKQLYEKARQMLKVIGAEHIDVEKRLGLLTVANQQLVQIAEAVGRNAEILIFDEPTSSLSQSETENLFRLIDKLKRKSITCIYISHRLGEIFRLCETLTVLRDGKVIGTKNINEITEDKLVEMMIGRSFEAYFPKHIKSEKGPELLRVENLSSPGKFENVSFSLCAGQILGLAGLVGAGRTELAEAIFGLDKNIKGKIYLQGKEVNITTPSQALGCGIALVPEDRKRHGLVLSMNVAENICLSILEKISNFFKSIKKRKLLEFVDKYFNLLKIKAASPWVQTLSLSGGNQQKLVLAKSLATDCNILIVDEPTRGIDVGAKAEIHSLIDELAGKGKAVLLISSELPELINLATNILVFRQGKIAGSLARNEVTQQKVLRLMAGLRN
ncbi:MAG: sugar ABC transporter ATP-binding protein [Phycisphaerae bacterium]|nr:sugar ABC transporter ATP-binding protein [Phycisphaerae bacterium]